MCKNNHSHISPNAKKFNKAVNDGILLDNAIINSFFNEGTENEKSAQNGCKPLLDTYRPIYPPILNSSSQSVPNYLKLSFQRYWRKDQYYNILNRISKEGLRVGELSIYDKSIYYVNECVRLSNILIDHHRKAGFEKIEVQCDHQKEVPENPRCEECQEKYLDLLNASTEGIIQKSVQRLLSCGRYIAARELPDTGEAFKIGTKGCKHPLCPFCNFKKSARRKQDANEFFFSPDGELKDEFKGKYFYHLVLTVHHGKKSKRRGNYISEDLIENFYKLRDKKSTLQKLWKDCVYGGYYSSEAKMKYGYLNGHLHILLISDKNLISRKKDKNGFWVKDENGKYIPTPNLPLEHKKRGRVKKGEVRETITTYYNFEEELQSRWEQLTGDSDIFHLEPIYYKDDNDKKVYYSPDKPDKADGEGLKKALEETLKYTLKGGIDDLTDIGTEYENDCIEKGLPISKSEKSKYILAFIASIVKPSRKYFNTFGKLWGRGIFAKSEENKDEIEATNKELISPTTGQVYNVDDTRIVIGSYQRNFNIVTVEGLDGEKLQLLKIKDSSNLVICQSVGDAAEALNSSSYSYLEREANQAPKHFYSTRQRKQDAKEKDNYGFRLTQPFKKLPSLLSFEQWVQNGIYDASLIPQDNLDHRNRVRKLHAAHQSIQLLKDTSKAEIWGGLMDELQYNFPMQLRTNDNTNEGFLLNSLNAHLNESDLPF